MTSTKMINIQHMAVYEAPMNPSIRQEMSLLWIPHDLKM